MRTRLPALAAALPLPAGAPAAAAAAAGPEAPRGRRGPRGAASFPTMTSAFNL